MELERSQKSTLDPCNDYITPTMGGALALLQEKWVLFIVYSLLPGPLGFNELSRRAVNVNTRTLSLRLDLLEAQGIITRTVHSSIPPRTSYALTEKGKDLQPVMEAIQTWSEQYAPDHDVPA